MSDDSSLAQVPGLVGATGMSIVNRDEGELPKA